MKPYHLGIVTAMHWETRLVEKVCERLSASPHVVNIACSGMGAEAAASAAQQLVQNGADALVSIGCCGGLNPEYNSGDVIIAHSAVINDGSNKLLIASETQWQTMCLNQYKSLQLPFKVCAGVIADTKKALEDKQQKQQLYAQSKADVVDMESAAVFTVGQQQQVPTLAIRSVLDTATDTLSPVFTNSCDTFGNVKWATLVANLLKQPKALKYAHHLARQQRLVKKNLGMVIQELHQNTWLLNTQQETNHV